MRKKRWSKKMNSMVLGAALCTALALVPGAAQAAVKHYRANDVTPVNTYTDLNHLASTSVTWQDGDILEIDADDSSLTGPVNINTGGVNITVKGTGTLPVIVTPNGTAQHAFRVGNTSSSITFEDGITLKDFANTTTEYGGAVYSAGDVTLKSGMNSFEGNYVVNHIGAQGGAIYSFSAFEIKGGTNSFKGNYAESQDHGEGGAIFTQDGFVITGGDNSFTGNYVDAIDHAQGGAVSSQNNFTITGGRVLFEGNHVQAVTDSASGGAVFSAGTFTIRGGNSEFKGNYARAPRIVDAVGGAVLVYQDAVIDLVNVSDTATFQGNYVTDGVNRQANSLYFDAAEDTGNNFAVKGAGTLYMHDPIARSKDSALRADNALAITKSGTGTWLLGGVNDTPNTTWAINEGTFITDFDVYDKAFAITSTDNARSVTSFSLGQNASMLVTVGGTEATIEADSITLAGTVGLNNEKIGPGNLADGEQVALKLVSGSINNTSRIVQAEGVISDSLRDSISYSNLRWEGKELKYNLNAARAIINNEAAGVYTVQGTLQAALYNQSNGYIFQALSANQGSGVQILKLEPEIERSALYLTGSKALAKEETKTGRFWGAWMQSLTRTKQKGWDLGSGLTLPGFILGVDKPVSDKTRLGLAMSATWPDYEQGSTKVEGHDVRVALYSSTELGRDMQLDLLASAGFGKLKSKRTRMSERMHGEYDTSSYALGAKLSKHIQKGDSTFSPFVSYEYLHLLADGFSESGVHALDMTGQNNSISRAQLGLGYKHEAGKNLFAAALYYQRLFGDTDVRVTSWLTADPLNPVSASGTGLDENSLGIYLGWQRELSAKTSINLSYNGLYGSDSKAHAFSLGWQYRF